MAGNVYTFREAAARHRFSLQYSIPWATGARVTVPLNNIGYLNELQILFNLTVTVGTAGTVTDAVQAKTNYLPYLALRSPQGAQIWSTNSRDIDAFNFRLWKNRSAASDPSYATWSPGSATAQSVIYRLRIPVAMNDDYNFDLGLLMRQISNNQFFLDMQFATFANLIGTGSVVITSIAGTVVVEEIYYDAVVAGSNVQPPNFSQFIRLRSLQSNALVQGQNDVRYDTGPIMTDAMHLFVNNSSADGSIPNLSYINFVANKGNSIDNRTGQRIAYDNAMHLGQALPAGWYHEDFNDDNEMVNATRARDFINSALAAQLDFLAQYGGTPSGTSYIESLYREIVTLAA